MTQGYEKEQADNQKRVFALSEQLKSDVKQVDTTKVFLDIVERTTDPEKLTEYIVRDFIDKIVVHYREVVDGVTTQKVEIFYNVIGKFEPPPIFDSEESQEVPNRRKKTVEIGLNPISTVSMVRVDLTDLTEPQIKTRNYGTCAHFSSMDQKQIKSQV